MVSTRSACRRYAAVPRTSSIGLAAAATCSGSLALAERRRHEPGHGARRAERGAELAALAVGHERQRDDRDHHRVPRPDLHERLRSPAGRLAPRRSARPARARSASARGGTRASGSDASRARLRARPRRPRRAAAATRRRPAKRCRGCRRSCRGCGSAATRPCATPPRAPEGASASAGCIASAYVSPAPSLSVPFSRTQPRSSGTSLRFSSTWGRRRSKFNSTMTSVPPAIGWASGRSDLRRSASSSERGVRTSTAPRVVR